MLAVERDEKFQLEVGPRILGGHSRCTAAIWGL